MTFTVAQLAERWRCKSHTVLSCIHSGELRAFNLSRGRRPTWRIPEEAIIEFEEKRSNRKPAKRTRRQRSKAVERFFPELEGAPE